MNSALLNFCPQRQQKVPSTASTQQKFKYILIYYHLLITISLLRACVVL
jgi:hypothetical protein